MRGRVARTLVRGETVYEEGRFVFGGTGRLVRPAVGPGGLLG